MHAASRLPIEEIPSIFMKMLPFRSVVLIAWLLTATNYVAAQTSSALPQWTTAQSTGRAAAAVEEKDGAPSKGRETASVELDSPTPATAAESKLLSDWLMRLREASKKRAYVGTFVVSSGGTMTSAKIWHVCEGDQQIERVEILSGAPRSIFRHNDQVVTFIPDHMLVRSEKRESLGLFPDLLDSTDTHLADFYKLKLEGADRVAGVDANIVALVPKDRLRFGYRVWTERRSGLVVKLQTLDTNGRLLEQAAFSELDLDAPVKMDKLLRMMGKVEGYQLEKPLLVKTSANTEGWIMKVPVAGFKPMSCYRRPLAASSSVRASGPVAESFQWVFSDGLSSVSIFVEPLDRQRQYKESALSLGATHTMTRKVDPFWVTVMGEVPMSTLLLFANGLERKK